MGLSFKQLNISKAETGETILTTIDKQTKKLTWFVNPVIKENNEIIAAHNIYTEDDIKMPKED